MDLPEFQCYLRGKRTISRAIAEHDAHNEKSESEEAEDEARRPAARRRPAAGYTSRSKLRLLPMRRLPAAPRMEKIDPARKQWNRSVLNLCEKNSQRPSDY